MNLRLDNIFGNLENIQSDQRYNLKMSNNASLFQLTALTLILQSLTININKINDHFNSQSFTILYKKE